MRAIAMLTLVVSTCLSVAAYAEDKPPARVPLVPVDTDDPVLKPMFEDIIKRGGEPSNMHRAVGNASKLFKEYAEVAWTIRRESETPRQDIEIMIMRAAQLAGGDYEFKAHTGMAISCGLTQDQVDAFDSWKDSDLFNDRQRSILAYADGLADPDSVDQATFDTLAQHFNPREIVELTITGNFYTAAARLTRALDIQMDPRLGTYGKCE